MIRLPIEQATPCVSKPEAFFPPPGVVPHEAKRLCRQCPVQAECANAALSLGYKAQGVWGGLSEYDRGNKKGRK